MILDYTGPTQQSEEWQRGFEVGVLYALMCSRHQSIIGTYWKKNEETIFSMARLLGYSFEWNVVDPQRSSIRFVLPFHAQSDEAGDGVG